MSELDSKKVHEPLRIQNLRKQIGGFSINADFDVQSGERLALIGPSGSGKTTLLRVLAGLEPLDGPEDRGRILLGDTDITQTPPQERGIGFVFQDAALFPALSVLENAAFGLRVRGVSKDERRHLTLPWLQRLGLDARAGQSVQGLSGGERSRIAFVRALVWRPRLLLLDEPFSALDRKLRGTLWKELLDLHHLWPVPLILVTHDREDVEAIATDEAVISDGVIKRTSRNFG